MKLSCNNHVSSFNREEAAVAEEDWSEAIPATPAGFRQGVYTFVYDYPLSREACFPHELTPEMSWIDLLLLAKADYEEIYRREDAAVGATANIPGMLNRSVSEGPFGIWGHHLGDLFFEAVDVNEERCIVDFGMGS